MKHEAYDVVQVQTKQETKKELKEALNWTSYNMKQDIGWTDTTKLTSIGSTLSTEDGINPVWNEPVL